jgi:hypothetical protein
VLTGLLLAAAIALTLHIARKRPSGAAAGALLCQAGVWLDVDEHFEGPHLVHLSAGHGLVAADLVAVAVVGAALWTWHRARRGRAVGLERRRPRKRRRALQR